MPVNYSNFTSCVDSSCTKVTLPSIVAGACECNTWTGRLNDLYFIDCSLAITEANLLDTAWWQANIDNGKIKNIGVGIGGFNQKAVTSFDAGGCGSATVEAIEWALNYQVFCVDKSSAYSTHEFASAMIGGALKNYNLIARFCDGDNVILPIGKVDLGSFDNALPTSTTEFMSFSYEFNWKSLSVPTPLEVAGLAAVLPKATRG